MLVFFLMADNFTCSDPELSRINVTTEAWIIQSEGPLHDSGILIVAVCLTLIIAIGIPWNIVVLAFIIQKKHFKEPTYILLISLVITDLLVCSCGLTFSIASAFRTEFNIGSSDYARCQVCHTVIIITVSLIFISLFILALMSLDRLIYIKYPILYEAEVTPQRILPCLLVVCVFCILVSLPPVFGFGEIKFSTSLSACSLIAWGTTRVTANIYYMALLSFVGFFPFMTTLIVNIWLLIIVCKSVQKRHKKRTMSNNSRMDSENIRRNSEKQFRADYHKQQILLAQVFGAIFIANVVTWVPIIVIAVAGAVFGAEKIHPLAYTLVYLAYTSQPAIHPILESCLIGKARVALFNSLFFWKRKSKNSLNSKRVVPQ